jgi:hypothetical protein
MGVTQGGIFFITLTLILPFTQTLRRSDPHATAGWTTEPISRMGPTLLLSPKSPRRRRHRTTAHLQQKKNTLASCKRLFARSKTLSAPKFGRTTSAAFCKANASHSATPVPRRTSKKGTTSAPTKTTTRAHNKYGIRAPKILYLLCANTIICHCLL